ncbi:hypothetical protein FRC03_002142 [Tulasnella sp. 419]|nr:hypothetical protein FRC03_002142 [Tulasnella sp. 419]
MQGKGERLTVCDSRDTNLRLMQSISQMTALKYLRAELMFLLHPITEIAMESIAYPVTLPNLQELSLRISGPSTAFWAWMINLNAPRLWHLFLQHYIPNLDDHNDEEQEQEQQGQAELAGLRTRIRLPSLTHFHCQLEPARWSGGSKNFDLIAFMPAIATVSHITLFSWSGTRTLLAFLTFNCTFPHLEHVKFLVDVDDPGEEERMLSEAIARLNPNATFTFEDY